MNNFKIAGILEPEDRATLHIASVGNYFNDYWSTWIMRKGYEMLNQMED